MVKYHAVKYYFSTEARTFTLFLSKRKVLALIPRRYAAATTDIKNALFYGVVGLIITVVVIAFSALIFFGTRVPPDEAARKSLAIETFNHLDQETRITLLPLISATLEDVDSDDETASVIEPIYIPEHAGGYIFFHYWLPVCLLLILLIFSIVSFICFVTERNRRFYIMALDYKKFITYIFLLTTVIPFAPVYAVSGIRYCYARKKASGSSEPNANTHEPESKPDNITRHSAPFTPNPKADQLYANFRKKTQFKIFEARVQELQRTISHRTQELTSYGQRIQEIQREINERKSQLGQLVRPAEITDEKIQEEFQAIGNMRGIAGFKLVDNYIVVRIEARVLYEGIVYDFGDWDFGVSVHGYHSERIRSGRTPHGSGVSAYMSGDGFCFGVREDRIEELIAKGEYVEAIAVAVDCHHTVNSSDERFIPDCFCLWEPENSTSQKGGK